MSEVILGEWEGSNLKLCSLLTDCAPQPSPEVHRHWSFLSLHPRGQMGKLRLREVQQSQALVRGGAPKPVFQNDAICEGDRKEPGAPGD